MGILLIRIFHCPFYQLKSNNEELKRSIREKGELISQQELFTRNLEKKLERVSNESIEVKKQMESNQKLLMLREKQIRRLEDKLISLQDDIEKLEWKAKSNSMNEDGESDNTAFPIMEYVENKAKIKELQNSIKTRERKIEIATMRAKQNETKSMFDETPENSDLIQPKFKLSMVSFKE